MTKENVILERTKKWIHDFVVGLQICPFAKHPFNEELIAYRIYDGTQVEQALESLANCLQELEGSSPTEIETSLLLLPNMLTEFDDYWNFVDLAEGLLMSMKLEGIIQLATFHPNYLFAGSSEDHKANYTNRSPCPMIHLLREDSVFEARQHHPDVEKIPDINIKKMESLSIKELKKFGSH